MEVTYTHVCGQCGKLSSITYLTQPTMAAQAQPPMAEETDDE